MILTAKNLRGVWATVLLDIGENGNPRLDCIAEQVAHYASAGVSGVYCNGTATEFHCQDELLCRSVMERTLEAGRMAKLPVQLGAAHPLAQNGLERVKMAAALQPDAIQITLPDWTAIDMPTAGAFLKACVKAAKDCPLVLYNPPHAKTVLAPDQLARIADEHPTIIGLKCGGGNAQWYGAMQSLFQQLSVFIPGHFYASGIAAGAHGAYSNMSCLNPAATVIWAQLCNDDHAAALDLERRIAKFIEMALKPIIASGKPNYACDKAMAAAGGWAHISPRLMWPYHGADAKDVERIVAATHKFIPEFAA